MDPETRKGWKCWRDNLREFKFVDVEHWNLRHDTAIKRTTHAQAYRNGANRRLRQRLWNPKLQMEVARR